ncbi:pRL2-11 [Streptomyces olivaceiscleroticus]|uniref:FtsK domain-containing protein n=1 Tax=Streptomyces olivaceiscleroticus TaxID=68245 RepID=A0ABN1A3I8_9ACTN
MAQSKFDKQVEESAEALVFGIGRVLAGRDLDGVKRTDATFWRSGTRVPPKVEGRVPRRSYRAGWQRLAFRLALGAGVSEGSYLLGRDPEATAQTVQDLWENRYATLAALETGGIGAASALAVGGVAYGLLTRERRELMREWVIPLHEALAQPLGLAEQTAPRRYLHVPKNFSDDDAEIRIDLPVHLRFSRDVVADLVTQKLALEGVTFSWHPAGRTPYVLVKKTRKPPARALFKDCKVRELVAKAPESAPVIGIGAGGRIVSVDLDAESPHILVNASTGGGKSVTLRSLTCQMLHHGSLAFVLDTKRISHAWARGTQGVTYCADITDIHDALVGLADELKRRNELAADQLADMPWLIVAMDSANGTLRQLARYWETLRQKDAPKTSPAVTALEGALWSGRSAGVHVILDGTPQTSVLGAAARELFATVILAWCTADTWQHLAPIACPSPKQHRFPQGRVHVVQEGDAHETQAIWMTDADVVNWLTDPEDHES